MDAPLRGLEFVDRLGREGIRAIHFCRADGREDRGRSSLRYRILESDFQNEQGLCIRRRQAKETIDSKVSSEAAVRNSGHVKA